MGIFNEKEIKYILATIFILAIVFGFNDKTDTFDFSHWINNFLLVLIAVAVSFLLSHIMHRAVARKLYAISDYELWNVRRFGFAPHMRTKIMKKEFVFPAGIIFPIIVALFSNGLFYFPVAGTYKLVEDRVKRVGKLFNKVSGYERAIICLSGPFTNLVLFFLFLFFENITNLNFSVFIIVNMWMALYGLLPLPGLIGVEILFGSLPFYLFAIVFFVSSIILAPLNLALAIVLALVLAITIVLTYFLGLSK